MKSLYLSAIFILTMATIGYSQTPYLFNYQAIVHDITGQVVDNQSVGIKISILQGTSTGSAVFSETHNVTTDGYGLVNLQIGSGTNLGPQLSSILWYVDLYFIKIEIDPAGGTAYTITSTSQLISVPYAMQAETVVQNDDADADPTNEYNTAAVLNGTDLEISDAGGTLTVDLLPLVDDADPDPTNEIQTITKVGSIITLSLGGGAITDDVNDADSSPTNEFNTDVTLVGNMLNVIDFGSTQSVDLSILANDADANPTNEMNTDVTFVGTILSVIDANSTQFVDLAALEDDADANPTNEMNSDVTFVGTTLTVIDGASSQFVDLSSLENDADFNPANEMNSDVTLVGTILNVIDGGSTQFVDLVSLGNDADANPTNEIQNLSIVGSNLTISGGNTVALPGGSDSQTLTLVGSDLTISGGNTVTLGGGTDSQTLTLVGQDLTILNGNTITLPVGGGSDSQTLTFVGNNLTITGGNTVDLTSLEDDADANPTNEIQTLSLVGGDLTISGGNTVTIPVQTHHVGQFFGGGIIVYVDSTGQHGLICGLVDLGTTTIFESGANNTTAFATSLYDGQANTATLVALTPEYPAADLCEAYSYAGFTDWYLPSAFELETMLINNYALRQYALIMFTYYWSSSENASTGVQAYAGRNQSILLTSTSETSAQRVRPMRKF